MSETEKDQLKKYNYESELLKKLTDFSSDIEIKSDNEYICDVYYDTTNKDSMEPTITDEEFFKLFDNNNLVSSNKI